ncbi:MAG: acyl-CoA dehydrogenase family protein [Bacteroidetes bacterium]|jgi:butyryl-CoA dehydrogenase|nr:acyl-CoA dehydrogenase family protein [Bacteroidota bacterium]
MLFPINPLQLQVRDSFADFVDREVLPQAAAIDHDKAFPKELFERVGHLGFYAMRYPESVGGSSMDTVSYMLATMELARGSLSLAAACTMQSLMATYFLFRFGNQHILDNYLSPALQGRCIGAICMTEPGAGSDLMAIKTLAKPVDGGYLLSGQKTWVTSAPVADFFTVLARVVGDDRLSVFFVPRQTQGLEIGKTIDKMGVRGSLTAEVFFADAFIPAHHLLGGQGQGTGLLREILAEIRLMTAALAIGTATAAMQFVLEYAKNRVQFGKPIGQFQAIRSKFADMAVSIDLATNYVLQAASLCDEGKSLQKEAMIAKLYASEMATEVCDQAARVMASYGYATDFPIERLLRDVRFTLIGGGTSEILKINISKELGL